MELEGTVRIETAGHIIEGNIILGEVKQLFLGDKKGYSRISIYDEVDECFKEVLVHTEIFKKILKPRQIENARILLGARSYKLRTRDGETFTDYYEVIHIISGPLAGQTLVFKNEINPD